MAKEKAVKEKAGKKPQAEPAAAEPAPARDPNYVPRLLRRYRDKVVPAMKDKFGYTNVMMVPTIEKVVVNMGLGAAISNPKLIETAVSDLRVITGQQPVVRKARKSIASFKLRQGQSIGVKVTLRASRMWEFVDRLFSLALPRVRDFKGVSPKGFDQRGNFTMGVREQTIFPDIDYDKVDAVKGMNISFVTTARTNEEGRELLRQLGMPFRGLPVEVN
ncbi:MAG: 50S ribosomal protein L5 [Polyangiaceae bacterium]|nr:50S ribosomal protein L5 [Polyangiaceae bacterium]